jgi:hypothetical protein
MDTKHEWTPIVHIRPEFIKIACSAVQQHRIQHNSLRLLLGGKITPNDPSENTDHAYLPYSVISFMLAEQGMIKSAACRALNF